MKRNAPLLAVVFSIIGSLSFAEPLPEPMLFPDAAALSVNEYPLPRFEPAETPAGFASELWAENPDPFGIVAFDPSVRLGELWGVEPEFRASESFSPFALLPDLLAFSFAGTEGSEPPLPMEFVSVAAFVQESSVATDAQKTQDVDEVVLRGLLNNEHYRESLRLKKLAVSSFDYGDYDASAKYAAAAAAAARRSDEYVALRLKIRAVDEALAKAKERLEWAASVGAERNYSGRFVAATAAFEGANKARAAEKYDLALELARKVLAELASVREAVPLPQRYKVRPWAETRDCFWNIAGYPWVYGDPTKWKILYEANKTKLRRPNNPDLLHVGTILTIPSIKGEFREGMWDAGTVYTPLSER